MKLIFIHGCPATGKLTIANELSKLTEYKIFHNHLSMDLVNSVFKPNTDISYALIKKIRLMIFKKAAEEKIKGLIFTFSDVSGDDFKFAKNVVRVIESNGGKVCFVHLSCKEEELFKRVKSPSRKKFGKFTSVLELKEGINKWNFDAVVPFRKTLQIDNTNLSAKKVAEKIKNYYGL